MPTSVVSLTSGARYFFVLRTHCVLYIVECIPASSIPVLYTPLEHTPSPVVRTKMPNVPRGAMEHEYTTNHQKKMLHKLAVNNYYLFLLCNTSLTDLKLTLVVGIF